MIEWMQAFEDLQVEIKQLEENITGLKQTLLRVRVR
jgi:hypothetical protein